MSDVHAMSGKEAGDADGDGEGCVTGRSMKKKQVIIVIMLSEKK